MALFTTDLLGKLHKMDVEKALAKVAALAAVHDEEPGPAGLEYKRLRTLAELPAMVAGLARVMGEKGSPLAMVLAAGVTARLTLVEGVPTLEYKLPGATTTTGSTTRAKAKFDYFDNGAAIAPVSLKQHVITVYPNSAAAAKLKEYDVKDNLSKLGGWQAVVGDPVVSKVMTRTRRD